MNNDQATLREKLRGSFSRFRKVAVNCLEVTLDAIAWPFDCIDKWLSKSASVYDKASEAEPEAQAQEVRDAAIGVASAAGNFLVDAIHAGTSIAKVVKHSRAEKFLHNRTNLSVMLTSSVALVYDNWGWSPPSAITLPNWTGNFLIALFVTGLLLVAVKKGNAFLNASREMAQALKRLFRAIIALGGWYSINEPESESEKEPLLLTYMAPA